MQQNSLRFSRRATLAALAGAALAPRQVLGSGLNRMSGRAFGTSWTLLTPCADDLSSFAGKISALFAGIDRTFSPYRGDSVIARFNSSAARTVVHDKELAFVAGEALAIAQKSEGVFDPTVGPLVARWGFGPILRGGSPDWRGISVGSDDISKATGDLTLDLCGIAKGWALDRAADAIKGQGIDSFLFELGGEFTAHNRHPDGRDWRLAVDVGPFSSTPAPLVRLPNGAAAATSGVWRQSYALSERVYSHIIDTKTKTPVSGTLRSVTVISENAMMADGWATALCAAGDDGGWDLATSLDLAALFIVERKGSLQQVMTPSVRDFLA